jgi:hypothetical protein
VVKVNVADAAVAGTLIDLGVLSVALSEDNVTLTPPVGAAPVKVTAQTPEELGPMLVRLHVSEETSADVCKITLVLAELPL